MGSDIGVIFRALWGGAAGAELLQRDDMEADALMPSFVVDHGIRPRSED